MPWTLLRKGGTLLHIAYGKTYTNNLYGHDVRVRTGPSLEFSLDLNPNLRTRNKSENSYYDARELADGHVEGLKLLQLTDDYIIQRLRRVLAHAREVPREWNLIIELEGPHAFRVRPERDATGTSLFLRVVSEKARVVRLTERIMQVKRSSLIQ